MDLRDVLRDSLGAWRWASGAVALLVAAFLLLPILVIVPMSFTTDTILVFPPTLFSTQWYETLSSDPAWSSAFENSFRLTAIGATIATVTGTLAALGINRRAGANTVLRTSFLVPLVLPWIVYALGLNLFYDELGILGEGWAVAVGQAVLAFPLVFVTVSAGLARIDPALDRAARSLGSRWSEVVRRVELPLVSASIAGGAIFALAYCFDEPIVALFTVAPDGQTLPVQIFQAARDAASPAITAASTVVMAVAIIAFSLGSALIARRLRKLEDV